MANGQIITFYSYKGGTGRTMALANVAWILAANGKRVLVADWDLESPGLHRFFQPFMRDVHGSEGIIDMVRSYEMQAAGPDGRGGFDLAKASAQVAPRALSVEWEFPGSGVLELLPAGRQNNHYSATLSALDWDNFYERLGGGEFLDALRAHMKSHYEYTLIDSRTGLSDVADICSLHLPDVLVDCFTLSTQGIEGAAKVAKDVHQYQDRKIRVLPVPMRVDPFESERVQAGLAYARRSFAGLPAGMTPDERRAYWNAVEVPYRPLYAYEETLAVFGDPPGSPASLLASFERLTAQITEGAVGSLPAMDDARRRKVLDRFRRRSPQASAHVAVLSGPTDRVWADWVRSVIEAAGAKVLDEVPSSSAEPDDPPRRVVRIISGVDPAESAPTPGPYLAAYVADARLTGHFPEAGAHVSLAGLPQAEAVAALLDALKLDVRPRPEGVGFPGTEPKIFQAPARNARFTGREEDLGELRRHLRESGTAVVLPVAVHGLGGVGKTQLALEYVHRFKHDYDLVWWVDASEQGSVTTALADLGGRMEKVYGPIAPPGANATEIVRHVLERLDRNELAADWLIVFDNAEDIEQIHRLVPGGRGHKLITSRNRGWEARGTTLAVDLFTPDESVSYLRERVPSLSADDAARVAEAVGHLPLAVAIAGGWLAESGASVRDYLVQLQERGPQALSIGRLDGYATSVAKTWNLSLERISSRSPAASRLLEMCSMLAPEIHLDLVNSPATAAALEPLDPDLAEPMVIGRLVQELNRLSLIALDPGARQISVHRLVQAVVRDRMPPEIAETVRRDVHGVLAAAHPGADVDDPRYQDAFRMIWPHLIPSGAMTSPEEKVRDLFIDRVRFLWQQGDLEGGRSLAERIERAWQDLLAAEPNPQAASRLSRQMLRLRFNLSNILRDLALFKDSRALDEQVLQAQRELLGAEHPHTLMTAGGLTASLRALGRYRRALEMDRETYAAWRTYGEETARTLAAANNLAASYRSNGDFAAALRLDEETYERRRKILGTTHPLTMHSSGAIARDLLEAGRYADAAERSSLTLEQCRETLGADHRVTLNAQVLLGVSLRGTGAPKAAEPHFRDAVTGLTRQFGVDSNDALSARLSGAANLLALDRLDEGEAAIRAVHTVYEERLGGTHPHTLVCRVNLASALRLEQRMDEAIDLVRPASEVLERYLGPEHPYALAGTMVLAVLLADIGRHGQAVEIEEQLAERMRSALGPRHPDTLRCRANLLLTRMELGDRQAERERDEALAEMVRLLGEAHPHIDTIRGGRRLVRAVDPQPF